jgi:TusA-related sulfurtransferase
MAPTADRTLDVRGMMCPGPIVQAKKEFDAMTAGQVLKVMCTDKSSLFDFQAWSKMNRAAALLEQETTTDTSGKDLYVHYIKRER